MNKSCRRIRQTTSSGGTVRIEYILYYKFMFYSILVKYFNIFLNLDNCVFLFVFELSVL